jgi:hypothetical protein
VGGIGVFIPFFLLIIDYFLIFINIYMFKEHLTLKAHLATQGETVSTKGTRELHIVQTTHFRAVHCP